MKKSKTLIVSMLTLASFSALADDFNLTINNNTSDSFNLTVRPSKALESLKPGEQNKVYALDFMPERTPDQFALLLSSPTSAQKASVFYKYPTIFCNSTTTYYHCSFQALGSHSATLTLSKN